MSELSYCLHNHWNRQISLVLGCLQASFHPFSPHIASAQCAKGKALPPQRPLLGLVAATVLLGHHAATVAFQRTLLRQALAQTLGLQRTYFQRLLKSLGLS